MPLLINLYKDIRQIILMFNKCFLTDIKMGINKQIKKKKL